VSSLRLAARAIFVGLRRAPSACGLRCARAIFHGVPSFRPNPPDSLFSKLRHFSANNTYHPPGNHLRMPPSFLCPFSNATEYATSFQVINHQLPAPGAQCRCASDFVLRHLDEHSLRELAAQMSETEDTGVSKQVECCGELAGELPRSRLVH
jgi:hypothetical protein